MVHLTQNARRTEFTKVYHQKARAPEEDEDDKAYSTVMMKILGPVTKFVNRPWKVMSDKAPTSPIDLNSG